jgi:IS1 family transposase
MNKLSTEKQAQIIHSLVEGNSIRATCRMTGAAKGTVLKLLAEVGAACDEYQNKTLVNLTCKRIQADEIWSFVYAKEKNVPEELQGTLGIGDVYTWTAIEAETKLAVSWLVGKRDGETAKVFMQDVASRLKNRVQLTTDGLKAYLEAVEDAFGSEIDFAQLVKIYGSTSATLSNEARYSPPKFTEAKKIPVTGSPDRKHISTSYVERQNLTMRMSMRRFTRLTNAFSKKIENLEHAVALHFMYYNFCRVHQTLRVTPAMEAKVTDHVWTILEVLELLDK